MTDTERAISFFEHALENCVMVARKPFETALSALRRTAEDEKAREEGLTRQEAEAALEVQT